MHGQKNKVKFVLYFLWFFLKVSRSKNNSVIYYHKCARVFTYSTCCSCQVLIKLEFSQQIFEKILKYQISWKSVQRGPSYSKRTGRQTDGRIWRSQ